jgi:general secretion pathway protein A
MYQAHWGLRDDPFRNSLDPGRFFRSPPYDEALARLHFLIEGAWRFGLVLGPAGIGKSLLTQVFASELKRTPTQVVQVALQGLECNEVLWHLAAGLGLAPGTGDRTASLWRQIMDRLTEFRYQQLPCVIILDDLDRAASQVPELVGRLLHASDAPESRITIVATAQAGEFGRLGRLLDLVDLRIDLAPWTLEETADYLRTAVMQAGCTRSIFHSSAVESIHQLSRGVPRRINQLAELVILAGAANALRQIDAQTVQSVDAELALPAAAAAH